MDWGKDNTTEVEWGKDNTTEVEWGMLKKTQLPSSFNSLITYWANINISYILYIYTYQHMTTPGMIHSSSAKCNVQPHNFCQQYLLTGTYFCSRSTHCCFVLGSSANRRRARTPLWHAVRVRSSVSTCCLWTLYWHRWHSYASVLKIPFSFLLHRSQFIWWSAMGSAMKWCPLNSIPDEPLWRMWDKSGRSWSKALTYRDIIHGKK